jgi:hypothetical protein
VQQPSASLAAGTAHRTPGDAAMNRVISVHAFMPEMAAIIAVETAPFPVAVTISAVMAPIAIVKLAVIAVIIAIVGYRPNIRASGI